MNEEQIKLLLNFIAVGTKVLSVRIAMFLSLILTAGMFGYVLYEPSNLKLLTATIFATLVFLPVLSKESKNKEQKNEQ